MSWYQLKVSGIKNSKIRALMMCYEKISDLLKEKEERLKTFLLDDTEIKLIHNLRYNERYIEIMEYLDRNRIGIIDMNDERYPDTLRNISKPPLFLFYKGDINLLNEEKIISVVGTRKATKYGEACTKRIVEELVENDVVIVSGLAVGIDITAHRKVLEMKGKTVAVLGCGIDKFYPAENYKERKQIEKYGLVITEFPLGYGATPKNFPIRNRIIAGLGRGVLVIESKEKGGSLITADIALEEGREVFVVPGDINSTYSKGCNNLIKESKGKLVTSGYDILEEFCWESRKNEKENKYLMGEKLKVYELLNTKMSLDEIKKYIGKSTEETLEILMELEINRYIQSLPGGYYKKCI